MRDERQPANIFGKHVLGVAVVLRRVLGFEPFGSGKHLGRRRANADQHSGDCICCLANAWHDLLKFAGDQVAHAADLVRVVLRHSSRVFSGRRNLQYFSEYGQRVVVWLPAVVLRHVSKPCPVDLSDKGMN